MGLSLLVVSMAACTFDGVGPSDNEPPADGEPVTLTFQQGSSYVGTLDTEVDEDNPNEDRSGRDEMRFDTETGNSQNRVMALLQFQEIFGEDVGQIPADAVILSATLSVTVVNGGDTPGLLCDMVRDWESDVAWGSFADGPQGTTDYDEEAVGMVAGVETRHSINVLASVQNWHRGDRSNNGWLFFPASTQGIALATSEAESEQRPALEVGLVISK